MSQRNKLSSVKRRRRKEQLAHRHGQHCAYCGVPFADLIEATLDHIAPYSVWRSWSVTSLMLACVDCNQAKADRFPLSIALMLLRSVDPAAPVVRPVDWPLLARLALANRADFESAWTPDPIPGPTGERSTPDLRDEPRHTRRHAPVRTARPVCRSTDRRPSIRPACLRATGRPARRCAGPTGEGVPA